MLKAQPTPAPIVVLKFGSSVLRTSDDLPEVVTEIYRAVRTGRRVVAVVSAFAGVTDGLLEEARARGCAHDNVNAPAYVAVGEESAAALTALACDASGLNAVSLKAPEIGLTASGAHNEATPTGFDAALVCRALDRHDVVVVPGFVATDPTGRTVLLGRGGSDLTAVFLSHHLGAERVRLVKDVDGVYDVDPAMQSAARRFHHVEWSKARSVAGKLIQTRALEFAEMSDLTVEVGRIGNDFATIVGRTYAPPHPPAVRRKLNVALAGCGVVGVGVAQRLLRHSDAFKVVKVLVRDAARTRAVTLERGIFTEDADAFAATDYDVLVDVLSCGILGGRLSEAALKRGAHVVSANKQAIVQSFDRLERARNASRLLYSAAVGGGAPLLEAVYSASRAGPVATIEGVLNGTVNYVLELLALGVSFDAALARARAAGLAEEDPSADLDGRDAAAKLELLSRAAFGRAPDELIIAPLEADVVRQAAASRLKQVSRVARCGERLVAGIEFERAAGGLFDEVRADRNAIRVTTVDGRRWRAGGRGAGRLPTTESVFADLVDLSSMVSP